ncbi:unnamed protein product [Amoebophrya sp. A120]|nr:unnamed protein product [Amoebophrya sp. A120]|eukprot:GSA120T00016091001.1
MHTGGHLSKEFFELVKQIGESRSKQEEDKIILNEVAALKASVNLPGVSLKRMKEFLIRAIYVEMLGHDCSLAYIHAVKLCNEKQIMAKRIGYLACNIFLHKDHEFMLLLINTLQRDLKSSNHLEVAGALISICRLVNQEMVPAILPEVIKCLTHNHESVRKKAIVALHKIYKLDSNIATSCNDNVRKVLCDQDPSVMGASLYMLHDLAKQNTIANKDLVPSFLSILKQIIDHRLPREFDYHRVPAPWIQIKLLSILGTLGHADPKASELMYPLLGEMMKKSDMGVNVGYAILYECVNTITKIYPHPPLLEQAAQSISRFISSDNHNLKYLGVTGLAAIVQMNPKYAAEHQMVVVDCLEDPDETLKRKTLDLLYKMTNPQNCTVVAEKLLFHLQTTQDNHLRKELTSRICTLAERYAPSNDWYLDTMTNVFQLGGDLLPQTVSHNLMRFVAEGTGTSDEEDEKFRVYTVNTFVKLLEKYGNGTDKGSRFPDVLIQVIAWVLGEYGSLCTLDGYRGNVNEITDLLCDCLSKWTSSTTTEIISTGIAQSGGTSSGATATETRCFLISALTKLTAQNDILLRNDAAILEVVEKYRESRSTDLQQRCYELKRMVEQSSTKVMQIVLPFDGSCEDVAVDKNLSFLNNYVSRNADASSRYLTKEERRKMKMSGGGVGGDSGNSANPSGTSSTKPLHKAAINFTPYEAPKVGPKMHTPSGLMAGAGSGDLLGGAGSVSGALAQGGSSGSSAAEPGMQGKLQNAGLGGLFDVNSEKAGGLSLQTTGKNAARKWGPAGYNEPAALQPQQLPNNVAGGSASSTGTATTAAGVASGSQSTGATTTNSQPQTAPRPAPMENKRQTEREKMAAALFSGMTATPAQPVTVQPEPPPGAGTAHQQKVAASLSLSSNATSSTTTTHTSPADDAQQKQVDLLGDPNGASNLLDSGAGGGSGTTKNPNYPAQGSSSDLLGGAEEDLLSLGPPAASTGQTSSAADLLISTSPGGPTARTGTEAPPTGNDLLSLDFSSSASPGLATATPVVGNNTFSPLPRSPVKTLDQRPHVLTPFAIKIDQLGAEWGTLPAERSVAVRLGPSVPTCDVLVQKLEQTLGVGRVEIIGQEAMLAGQTISGNAKVFLHAQFTPGHPTANIAIKGATDAAVDTVAGALQSVGTLG